jgi:hypothetical protein
MTAVAVHIGVERPAGRNFARLRSPRGTVDRLAGLCATAGVETQHRLLDARATASEVRATLAVAARGIGRGGLLVLSFSGHAERPVPGEHLGGWYLHDGPIRHTETAACLAEAPPTTRVVVVADTCHAASFTAVCAAIPATTVLLAACAANQSTLDHPVSEFTAALVRHLAVPRTYLELERLLQAGAPDIERPEAHANRPAALGGIALR